MDVFVELVGGSFIEDDGMVRLVLDYRKRRISSVSSPEAMSVRVAQGLGSRYLCLLTTSSFAFYLQMLLPVPANNVGHLIALKRSDEIHTMIVVARVYKVG